EIDTHDFRRRLAGRLVCHLCRRCYQEIRNGPGESAVRGAGQEEIFGHPLSQAARLRKELHESEGVELPLILTPAFAGVNSSGNPWPRIPAFARTNGSRRAPTPAPATARWST